MNGQAEAADILSPPQSPENPRKMVRPGFRTFSALGRDSTAQIGVVKAPSAVGGTHDQRQRSLFDPVILSHTAQIYDDKYADHGKYDFKASTPPLDRDARKATSLQGKSIPRLGLHPRRKTEAPIQHGPCLATSDKPLAQTPGRPELSWENYSTDSDSTEGENSYLDLHTDVIIKSPGTGETSSHGVFRSKKRKRGMDYVDDLVMSPSLRTGYASDGSDDALSYPEPSILVSSSIQDIAIPIGELSMAPVKRLKDSSTNIETLNGNDFVQLAQILADQLAFRDNAWPPTVASSDNYGLLSTGYATPREEPFAGIISTLFRNSEQCDLKTYVDIGVQALEEPAIVKAVVRSDQRRPTLPSHGSLRANLQHGISKMQVPYVRVQRTAKSMEVLSSAYPFWETLGLGPCHGPKEINAYCIYLSNDGIQRSVDTFLNMLGSIYDGCKLGTHKRGININGPGDGLVPVETKFEGQDSATRPVPEDFIQAVESACEDLGIDSQGPKHIERSRYLHACRQVVVKKPNTRAKHCCIYGRYLW